VIELKALATGNTRVLGFSLSLLLLKKCYLASG